MVKKIKLLLLVFFAAHAVQAKDYPIHSAGELSNLNLKPGDRAIMQPGDWSNQQLIFRGKGTKEAPITLITADPGKIIIKGNANLLIDGQWLVVDGLNFTQGFSLKDDVIVFSKKSEWCRLTNTAIIDYNSPDKKLDYKWVSLNGLHNRVDHCYLRGKNNQGATLVVWVSDQPNYHQIDHNFFDARPELGGNGGETIRIGTSMVSMSDSFTVVEDNIFYHCNGEMEVLSNKSSRNTIRNNLFFECAGTLTLRHGNDAEVYGNYIIGNGVKGTGGIRIVGENHKVYHNYLYGIAGTGLKAAISIMDGLPDAQLNGYWQVKNVEVRNNTIVNCAEAFEIGAGKRDGRSEPPVNIKLMNNIVLGSTPIVFTDQPKKIKLLDNLLFSIRLNSDIPDGFDMVDPKLQVNGLNIYQPADNSKYGAPALTADQKQLFSKANAGPAWYKTLPVIQVK